MEKSRMSNEWIEKAWAQYPNKINPNGTVTTGPVRAAFCQVLGDKPKNKAGEEKAWGTVLLFPDHRIIKTMNLGVLAGPINDLLREKAPIALTDKRVRAKYHDPFKKQDQYIGKDGSLYAGFEDGLFCISANSSQSRPLVVNQRNAPIVEKSGIYSGCWVLANLNPGWINREDKKGPTFYLDALMVVAEDEMLGGSGGFVNPNEVFGAVNIEAGDINPDAAFGEGSLQSAGADPFAS